MKILKEIVDKSEDIIAILDSNDFFGKNIFCPKSRLKIELQYNMQHKFDASGCFHLNGDEFAQIVSQINKEEISDTLYSLVDKGVLSISINENGELIYSQSKELEIQNMGGFIKIFRNEKHK
jgi:hypothetical protein